jgi:hypothetical protein
VVHYYHYSIKREIPLSIVTTVAGGHTLVSSFFTFRNSSSARS